MIAQVEAGLPVLSERVPAMIPPMMPPTSKMVDNIAASSASTYNMEWWVHVILTPNLVHDVNIVGKPVEKCVGDQLGKEQAEKLVKQLNFCFTWWKIQKLQEWRVLQRSWLPPPLPLLLPWDGIALVSSKTKGTSTSALCDGSSSLSPSSSSRRGSVSEFSSFGISWKKNMRVKVCVYCIVLWTLFHLIRKSKVLRSGYHHQKEEKSNTSNDDSRHCEWEAPVGLRTG